MRALLLLALTISILGCGTTPEQEVDSVPAPGQTLSGTFSGDPASLDLDAPLSLKQCLRLAETNVGTAGAFRAITDSTRAEVSAAGALPNPTVSLLFQDVVHAGHIEQGLVNFQPFSLWQRSEALRSARAGLDEAEARVTADRRDLHLEVGRAYYTLVAAEKLAALESEAASITSALATQVARRVEIGDASSLDLDRAQAERVDARAVRESTYLVLERERFALAFALRVCRSAPIRVEDRWPKPLSPALLSSARELSLGEGPIPAEVHPRLAQALARVERASARSSLEEGRKFGLDQAVLSLGVRRNRADYSGVIGLQTPLPIFDRNTGNRARARAELGAAEAALFQVREQYRIQVQSATNNWYQSRQALSDLRELVVRRESIVASASSLLADRHSTLQEVLVAQRDAVAARRRLIAAEFDVALAGWRLLLLVGGHGEGQL